MIIGVSRGSARCGADCPAGVIGYLLRFRREVLETEPGDVSVFKH